MTVMVGASRTPAARYPPRPFDPDEAYPEMAIHRVATEPNHVYPAVRRALYLAGMDAEHFGSSAWNPLGAIVRPGSRVLIKPNFIRHAHIHDPERWEQVVTHGSVLRPIVDLVAKALGYQGCISLADAPQGDADWDEIVARTGCDAVAEYCRRELGVGFELIDLRSIRYLERSGVPYEHVELPGDPRGSTRVNLSRYSSFSGFHRKFYGADYDVSETNRHHRDGVQEYLVSRSALEADAVIHVPKLKTHKKCGLTLSLKGLVGINTYKNWLPHFSLGAPRTGGDQYPAWSPRTVAEYAVLRVWKPVFRRLPRVVRKRVAAVGKTAGETAFGRTSGTIRSGNWYGNDTIWRMIVDLARVLTYADADGVIHERPQRRMFTIVDGVVAGDGEGPLAPDPVEARVILAGPPLETDLVAARLAGFDHNKIAYLRRALDRTNPLPLGGVRSVDDIVVSSDEPSWNTRLVDIAARSTLRLTPHRGWAGHIELDENV